MKIDFDKKIICFDGTEIYKDGKQAKTDTGKRLFLEDGITKVMIPSEEISTLADICKIALTRLTVKDQNLAGDKKFEFEQLAVRIYKGGVVEVTAEEVSLMKERIGFMFEPMVVGTCYRFLEDNDVE